MFKHHSEIDADRIKTFSNRYQEILGIRALFKISAADLDKRYVKLIKNLDKQSINTIDKILERVFIYRGVNLPENITQEDIPLIQFNKEEQKVEVNVFWHQCSVPLFKNQSKIQKGNIIDVGAYVGDSAIVMSRYTANKVYAFEPVHSNYELMLQTLKLNPEQNNIIPLNAALGKENTVSNICEAESSSSFAFNLSSKHEKVNVLSLDAFVEQNHLDVGLIKVDIEGFEQSFLQGAERTIKSQRPSLILSIYHNADDFFNIKPILEEWNLGYHFHISKPIDGQILYETVLLAETDR